MARRSSRACRRSAICTPASRRRPSRRSGSRSIPLVERMDYLAAQSNSLCYVLERREAARPRDAAAREGHPRADRRAAADGEPSDLDRHARDGNRRGVDAVLRDPRARAADEHQRARSPASASSRATSASAACARTCRAASTRRSTRSSIGFPSKIDEFEGLLTKNDIFLRRTAGRRRDHARRMRSRGDWSGPIARGAGSDYDVRKYFPYTAATRPTTSTCRRRPKATSSRATGCASRRCGESVKICAAGDRAHHAVRRLGLRRHARRAAAEGQGLHGDGSADSALPDLLAGLHRAGRRGVRAGRRAARRARLSTSCRTAPTGRGA